MLSKTKVNAMLSAVMDLEEEGVKIDFRYSGSVVRICTCSGQGDGFICDRYMTVSTDEGAKDTLIDLRRMRQRHERE